MTHGEVRSGDLAGLFTAWLMLVFWNEKPIFGQKEKRGRMRQGEFGKRKFLLEQSADRQEPEPSLNGSTQRATVRADGASKRAVAQTRIRRRAAKSRSCAGCLALLDER